MADVYLTTTHPHPEGVCELLRLWAARDRHGVHRLCESPDDADVILLAEGLGTEPSLIHARRHTLARRYREKVFVHSEMPNAIPFLPGVFTSLPARFFSASRHRSGSYIAMFPNEHVGPGPLPADPYLFAFVGDGRTAPLRRALLRLSHPEGFVEDTSDRVHEALWGDNPAARKAYQSTYAQALRDSLFALCPRGVTPSSVRVYEVMKTGRVPVILSDEWVPPEGPDWDAFSIRVREADVHRVPEILEASRERAAEMGSRARREWEAWFSPEVLFHHTVEACLAIARTRRWPERLLRLGVWRQVLAAPYNRIFLRGLLLDWPPTRALLERRHARAAAAGT